VNITRIKSTDLAYIHGQTVDNTLASGKMGSNTAKVSIRMFNKWSARVYGNMGRE
jgi:hypothetical protein